MEKILKEGERIESSFSVGEGISEDEFRDALAEYSQAGNSIFDLGSVLLTVQDDGTRVISCRKKAH